MTEIFLKIVNMSISAGWLVLAVLVVRLLLTKSPRWIHVLLWGIVAVRLICPFSIESALSLIPSAETIPLEIGSHPIPQIQSGVDSINAVVNPIISHSNTPVPGASAYPLQITIGIYEILWQLGVLGMLLYTVGSYVLLRRKLRTAVRLRENLFQCEAVRSPFVLGIFRPRIYLPYGMEDPHVIAHEKAHIRRKDHWWKPLGFLLLTVYWFNPMMWLAYILLCRDIELACDEKVIGELGRQQRADYTQALVNCSMNRRMITACPLAFGEVGVKARVKSILHYRKPTLWLVAAALVTCGAVAVCFLTDPKPAPDFAMKGANVSDLEPEKIIGRIVDFQNIENSGVYMNSNGFSLTVDSDFNWMDSQTVRYFFYEHQKVRSAQLRIYPHAKEYFLTEADDWTDQNRIFLLRHYLDAIKYLPQEAIRDLAPADLYLIEFVDGGSPSSCDRVITYSEQGAGETDGWYLHLRILPHHADGEGHRGTGDEAVHLFYGEKAVDGAQMWYDYTREPERLNWNTELEYTIKEFPGITFRCTAGQITAGDTVIVTGMPIWSAYLQDLTGDGCPEICMETSFGSGIIDNRIVVYDYANERTYSLEQRMICDYHLWRDPSGQLCADKTGFRSGTLLHSGRLLIRDGQLLIEGE